MISGKEKLIVVSNRVPYNVKKVKGEIRYKKSVGGLVTALDPILCRRGGQWIGWNGYSGYSRELSGKLVVGKDCDQEGYSLKLISLSAKEIKNYYHGFANRSLWPLFHGFISQSYFNKDYFWFYRKINNRFANRILEEINGDELIWIHDYQLCMTPASLRERSKKKLKIIFFLHIPFPNFEAFRVLPWDKEILKGLLGNDLVGFQTSRDAYNFLECCKNILDLDVDFKKMKIHYKGRKIEARGFPISIDFDRFNTLAKSRETVKYRKNIKDLGGDAKVVISVERLDYTKGIKERLKAVDRFFTRYPEYLKKVVFLQISVPSRTKIKEYIELKREIDELVGNINGKFSDGLWSPIQYLFKALPQQQLAALYKYADICLVTSLRDGMNLIGKEYASCNVSQDGVLILSELTGASYELGSNSLMVNPYDTDEVADALKKALNMHRATRKKMMQGLQKTISENNIYVWADNFLDYYSKPS
jgi:alpha,alpha-trehalose-phosphate synthase [UDP-forming]